MEKRSELRKGKERREQRRIADRKTEKRRGRQQRKDGERKEKKMKGKESRAEQRNTRRLVVEANVHT